MRNEERETRNEKRGTRNEKRETRNEERETRNEKRGTMVKIRKMRILVLLFFLRDVEGAVPYTRAESFAKLPSIELKV